MNILQKTIEKSKERRSYFEEKLLYFMNILREEKEDNFIYQLFDEVKKYSYKVHKNVLASSQFNKLKTGSCYDFTNYIYNKLKSKYKDVFGVFMAYAKDKDFYSGTASHTVPVVNINGKFIVIEGAFQRYKGIHTFPNLQSLIAFYKPKIKNTKNDNFFRAYKFIPVNRAVSYDDYFMERLYDKSIRIE